MTKARRRIMTMIVCVAVAGRGALPAAQQNPRFAVRTQGVLVEVEVTNGRVPVSALTASDFELRDNGVLQAIELVETRGAAISTVLALDTSLSTTGQRLTDLTAASRALLDHLESGDHAALTTFEQRVDLKVPLTTDFDLVKTALARVAPTGRTALFDGIYAALLATQAAVGRSLVIVYTDGGDTASWLQPAEVVEAARRSNAVLDVVVLRSARPSAGLKDLVETTGGQMFAVDSTRGLSAEFARIVRDFRSRYVLTFVPKGVSAGGFHRLNVRTKRGGLTVRARSGYFNDSGDY